MGNANPDNRYSGHIAALGNRLRGARVGMRLSQKEFGALGGVGLTTQQQYESGKTAPSAEYFYRLSDHGLDAGVLLSGQGKLDVPQPGSAASLVDLSNLGTAHSFLAQHGPAGHPARDDDDMVEVQEIDLAYGLGGTFSDGPIEVTTHRFPRAWIEAITTTPPSMLTFARGRGDSMQPTIQDGDMVLIDRSQRTVREWDAIWALTIGDMAMIKRVRARGERITILSDNERVPPDDVFHEEINIVGRVIFIGRRI